MIRSNAAVADENGLIARAAEGDREAFGVLYEQNSLRVFRHAYFLTGNYALAEDITAQTFLNALEAIHRYETRGVAFKSWLLRIAFNLVINYKKSFKNNGHSSLPDNLEAPTAFYSPEASAQTKADGELVWGQVRNLSEDQRQVVVMRFLDDLSYAEIADLTGKSVGAVRVLQFRALRNLRSLVQSGLNHAYSRRAS
jgi:RNA polymerase sigma-70 factor (ECF subfamily)